MKSYSTAFQKQQINLQIICIACSWSTHSVAAQPPLSRQHKSWPQSFLYSGLLVVLGPGIRLHRGVSLNSLGMKWLWKQLIFFPLCLSFLPSVMDEANERQDLMGTKSGKIRLELQEISGECYFTMAKTLQTSSTRMVWASVRIFYTHAHLIHWNPTKHTHVVCTSCTLSSSYILATLFSIKPKHF